MVLHQGATNFWVANIFDQHNFVLPRVINFWSGRRPRSSPWKIILGKLFAHLQKPINFSGRQLLGDKFPWATNSPLPPTLENKFFRMTSFLQPPTFGGRIFFAANDELS